MNTNSSFNTFKEDIEQCKDSQQGNLLVYTWQAFHKLPAIQEPHILDIGCGSGVQTIELSRLWHGRITDSDNDQLLAFWKNGIMIRRRADRDYKVEV